MAVEEIERRSALAHADLLVDLGRPDEALETLGPLLAADPDDTRALSLAALCHLGPDGDAVAALSLARRACEVAGDAELPRRLAALAYLRLNQPARAQEAATRAVELAPESWGAHFVLGTARLGDRRTRRGARDAARRAVELAPQRWECHQLLARTYLDGGLDPASAEVDAALAALERARRLNPDSTEIAHDLARAHLLRGRAAAAIAGFSAAAAREPGRAASVRAVHAALVLLVRYAAYACLLALALLWLLVPGAVVGTDLPGDTAPHPLLRVVGPGWPEWAAVVAIALVAALGLGGAWVVGALRMGPAGALRRFVRAEPLAASSTVILFGQAAASVAAVLAPPPLGRLVLWGCLGAQVAATALIAGGRKRGAHRARRRGERRAHAG